MSSIIPNPTGGIAGKVASNVVSNPSIVIGAGVDDSFNVSMNSSYHTDLDIDASSIHTFSTSRHSDNDMSLALGSDMDNAFQNYQLNKYGYPTKKRKKVYDRLSQKVRTGVYVNGFLMPWERAFRESERDQAIFPIHQPEITSDTTAIHAVPSGWIGGTPIGFEIPPDTEGNNPGGGSGGGGGNPGGLGPGSNNPAQQSTVPSNRTLQEGIPGFQGMNCENFMDVGMDRPGTYWFNYNYHLLNYYNQLRLQRDADVNIDPDFNGGLIYEENLAKAALAIATSLFETDGASDNTYQSKILQGKTEQQMFNHFGVTGPILKQIFYLGTNNNDGFQAENNLLQTQWRLALNEPKAGGIVQQDGGYSENIWVDYKTKGSEHHFGAAQKGIYYVRLTSQTPVNIVSTLWNDADPNPISMCVGVENPFVGAGMPLFTSGIPGIGDKTVNPSRDHEFAPTSAAGAGYTPGNTNPATQGCAPYSHPDWPRICPQSRTWAWQQAVSQPALDFGNTFRQGAGLPDMIWDKFLTLAAQRHATYIVENQANYPPDHAYIPNAYPGDPHLEALTNSFGETVQVRVFNTGRNPSPEIVAEGSGFGGMNTPMSGICNQKSDWVNASNPGHFGPWAQPGNATRYYGYGFDATPTGNRMWHVFVYANNPPIVDPNSLDELYTYLPKFYCGENVGGPQLTFTPINSDITQLFDMPEIGDIKTSSKTTNHNGWYLLDGQTISFDTDPTTYNNATTLFGGSPNVPGATLVLPNATDSTIMMGNGTDPINTVIGNNNKTLTRSDLPDFTLSVTGNTTASTWTNGTAHILHDLSGGAGTVSGSVWENDRALNISSLMAHSHTVTGTTSSINSSTQTSIDLRGKRLITNLFIYLS